MTYLPIEYHITYVAIRVAFGGGILEHWGCRLNRGRGAMKFPLQYSVLRTEYN